jgi:hypothetical protein
MEDCWRQQSPPSSSVNLFPSRRLDSLDEFVEERGHARRIAFPGQTPHHHEMGGQSMEGIARAFAAEDLSEFGRPPLLENPIGLRRNPISFADS